MVYKGVWIPTSTDDLSSLFKPTFLTLTALICSVMQVATELITGMNITSKALLIGISQPLSKPRVLLATWGHTCQISWYCFLVCRQGSLLTLGLSAEH